MKSAWRYWLLVGSAYFVITLLMTYPLALNLNSGFGGSHGDNLIFVWNRWWLREAWQKEHDPYFTTYMFYPDGASLLFHSMSWLNVFTWGILEPLTGEVGSYNLSLLANLMMCGVSAFALLRHLNVNKGAAFVGGLIYAYYPHHMSNVMKQPNLANVQWMPLYMLFLIRATRGGKYTTGLLAGLFLALTALSDWHLLTMGGILTVLWVVYGLVHERPTWSWRSLRNLALTGVILAVVIGPFLFPMAKYLIKGNHIREIMAEQSTVYQTDLLAYVIPSRYHPVFERLFNLDAFYKSRFPHNRNWQVFPGYLVLALVGYAFVRHVRRGSFWAFLALMFWVLALGPYLRVAGHLAQEIPLPYHLVANLSFIRALRAPNRLNAVLALPVTVLAALSISDLFTKAKRHWNWKKRTISWAAALLGCLILFEYLVVPFPLMQPRVSPFYELLRLEDGQFAVLDVPTGWGASRYHMYYQTIHHRPIVEGHVSRPIGDPYRFMRQIPLLSSVNQYNDWELALPDISRQLGFLADAGVRYVVVHKDMARDDQLSAWLDWITLQPIFEDEQLLVYTTQPEYNRDFRWQHDLGTEIGIIQASLGADSLSQGGVLETEIRWGSRAPLRDLLVQIALASEEGNAVQQAHWPILQDWAMEQWPASMVAIDHYRFQVSPFAPGGVYSVNVSLLDSATLTPVGNSATIGTVAIRELPRRFEPSEPTTALDAVFGEQLHLLGYDMQLNHERLTLILHWQALHSMTETWKFFVHIVDPNTGEVVTQADVMPRDWTYPTTWWAPGEYVEDTIVISLEDVPANILQVAIGVYHPKTGERLVTLAGEDRVVLPEEIAR